MTALVGIIMGSTSDWETMRFAAETLERLAFLMKIEVVSAHRTPDKLFITLKRQSLRPGSHHRRCRWCGTFAGYDSG